MNKDDKVYVAGHNGLIGSAIVRRLLKDGYTRILTRNRAELDLTDQYSVRTFFEKERPDYVFFAAAKVGGVFANNTYRAEFIYENIVMQSNVIHHSFLSEVKKMIFFACADIYPKNCPQPAKEEYLLTGQLEATCEPFALAKVAGVKMCESYNRQYGTDYIVVVPANVYGPNQHYDIMNAQVLPSLIKKFREAKVSNTEEVVIWGTGSPIRDFLFVDDVVDACIFLMKEYSGNDFFNIGTGKGYTILELAGIIKNAVGYEGKVIFDRTKPDGVPKKLLATSKINALGWKYRTELRDGVQVTYDEFLNELERKKIRTSQICYVEPSEKDIVSLNGIKANKNISFNVQPATYKNKVVIKPWGHEYLIFENDFIAIWTLYIKKGYSTSMHCHPEKKTSLILLSGNAMSNTFTHRNYLRGGDTVIIEKGVFHSTKSLSDDGIFLLEIETPPYKADLVRLEDRYGRESSGYEGVTEMQSQNLQDFDYFYFEETESYEKITHSNERFTVTFEVFPDNNVFQENFKIKEVELYTCCRGMMLDGENNLLLGIGNTQKAEILSGIKGINIPGKTVLLKSRTKDK